MSKCGVLSKCKFCWFAVVLLGISGLGTLSCRDSKEVGTFYLRSCETGRLIGPIQTTPGRPIPSLNERAYVVAAPTQAELAIRQCLIETNLYESRYIDCELSDLVRDVNAMLKSRLGEKAPPVRVDLPHGSELPPLLTMEITATSAYETLCNVAAKAEVHIFVEEGEVVLSRKEQREI